jgi:hypothetical protein
MLRRNLIALCHLLYDLSSASQRHRGPLRRISR